jgi:hypothetical protein
LQLGNGQLCNVIVVHSPISDWSGCSKPNAPHADGGGGTVAVPVEPPSATRNLWQQLPEAEQEAFLNLWADVDQSLKKAKEEKKIAWPSPRRQERPSF